MSIRQELASGKILVVSGDGRHGVISELTTKYRVDDLLDELKKEAELEMRSQMTENLVALEFGKNINFFTRARWLVKVVPQEDGITKISLGLPSPGKVMNDANSVYIPPYIVFLNFSVNGTDGAIINKQCYAYLYEPGFDFDEYMSNYLTHSLYKINPHVGVEGNVCTGDGLARTPNEFDLNSFVLWLQAFVDDFATYNPDSPIIAIEGCIDGQDALRLKIDGKSDKDIASDIMQRREASSRE